MRYQLAKARNAEAGTLPVVLLDQFEWNDHGYRNTFRAQLKVAQDSRPQDLGELKILQRGRTSPQLPDSFDSLPYDCCSLGQNLEYYERIQQLGEFGVDIQRGLRDLVQDTRLSHAFVDDPGYERSLLRFSSARYLLQNALQLLPGALSVKVMTKLPGATGSIPITLDLKLDPTRLCGRIGVLVGVNGTGKTQLLARIADATVGVDDEALQGEPKPAISRVVALSFSAFDQFSLPHLPVRNSYWYCGLRRRVGGSEYGGPTKVSVDPEDWGLDHLYEKICSEPSIHSRWKTTMKNLGLEAAIPDDTEDLGLLRRARTLGAGHKLACLGFTHLLARIRPRTLVLFDEPELHTHPRLLSLMMRELAALLEAHDSFAIVSTHSPIVLQEVPAKQIRVLRRTEGNLRISAYPGESFGEDLNEIVRLGFGLDHDERSYLKMLREEVDRHGVPRVREKYSDSLGLAAHLALASLEGDDL